MRTIRALAAAVALFSSTAPLSTQTLFLGPECVTFDEAHNRYLVSNWTDGRIICMDTGGVQTVFKAGFPHAYGNCIMDTTFYFSTGTSVIGLDLRTGDIVLNLPVPGSQQMDGMACDDMGNLYVLETMQPKIFKISPSTRSISTFVASGLPPFPQDLVFDRLRDRLVVCAWRTASPVMAVRLRDSTVSTLAVPSMGNFDGIAQDRDGYFYLSSWATNSVHRFDSAFSGAPVTVSSGHNGPSNLCYNARDHLLAVPSFNGNMVALVLLAPTGVEEDREDKPKGFLLHPNYPNPFNPSTTIRFDLPDCSTVRLSIYSMLGCEVSVLVDEMRDAGVHEVQCDASDLASGFYLYRLQAGDVVQSRKLLVVK